MLQTHAPLLFWGLLVLGGLTVVALLIQATLTKSEKHVGAPVERVFRQLGLDAMPLFLAIVLSVLWTILFLLMLAGLFGLIADVLLSKPPSRANGDAVWDWRFKLVQLTALTTVLGAVVVLPVTLQRLRLSKEQNETAKAALFNEKITEAAADLHARREVTKETVNGWETVWEDDIVRRNAAIDRLEGLLLEEPNEAKRVSRLLSGYVRELSFQFPPEDPPKSVSSEKLKFWYTELSPARSDLQNAVQVLGRMGKSPKLENEKFNINLSNANLQGMDLQHLDFSKSNFKNASLQGAQLNYSNLSGSNLFRCDLSYASFISSTMIESSFFKARLNGSFLFMALLQGSRFEEIEVNSETHFSGQGLQGARFKESDLSSCNMSLADISQTFGDRSVTLPSHLDRPAHWPNIALDHLAYSEQSNEFAKSQGYKIPEHL